MPMEGTLYDKAHLVAAAIRVLSHTLHTAPEAQNISDLLGISLEETGWILHSMSEYGIVEQVSAGSVTRYFLIDGPKIENLPRKSGQTHLDQELVRFKTSRQEMRTKVESIQSAQVEKQKTLFAEIEKKLKQSSTATGKGIR